MLDKSVSVLQQWSCPAKGLALMHLKIVKIHFSAQAEVVYQRKPGELESLIPQAPPNCYLGLGEILVLPALSTHPLKHKPKAEI